MLEGDVVEQKKYSFDKLQMYFGEDYKIYLNYSQNALPLKAYDLISETNIKEIVIELT